MTQALPDPALKRPVPQYPTPVVPDFATKSGHIILIEKVSIQVGSWNPQPLDGSITYSGIDANKFPTPLYLVAEKVTQDGVFCLRYWANDRTLSSQDPWNYGISYSSEDPDYPIIERNYLILRSSYSTVPIGTTDPVFGGTAVVAKQMMKELPEDNPLTSLFVQVVRIYETIPGPVISGYQYDEFFETDLTISKQTIAAGTAEVTPYDGLLSYKDEPIDSVKSVRTLVTTPSLPPTRTEYKTGTFSSPNLIFDITAASAQLGCGAGQSDIRIKLTPITRASQNRQTIFRTTTSYTYGEPTPPDFSDYLFLELKQVVFTGFIINFDLGAALCDHLVAPDLEATISAYGILAGLVCVISFVGTTDFTAIGASANTVGVSFTASGPGTGSGTVNVGGISGQGILVSVCEGNGTYEAWDIAATTPSATDYNGYIGTFKKLSWNAVYWKAGIWEAKQIEVKVI